MSTTEKKPIAAFWSMSLDCECPSCKKDVDLLNLPDFWHHHSGLVACENSTERSRQLEVVCPECGHEFVVDCQY